MTLRLQYMPLSVLKKWPRNPKLHDVPKIENSMKRFGFTSPIIIDEKSGLMVAGHGRVDTLLQMKDAEEPAPQHIRVKGSEWYAPVIRGLSFRNKKEVETYILADNQTTIAGGWDEQQLGKILSQMEPDLQAISGFEPEEIKDFVAQLPRTDLNQETAEEIPEVPLQPVTQPGDIWQLGKHRIMCGDSTKKADVEKPSH